MVVLMAKSRITDSSLGLLSDNDRLSSMTQGHFSPMRDGLDHHVDGREIRMG